MVRHRSPFFAHALVALAALYMSKQEAAKEGFGTPTLLSDWHTLVAREYSRQTVDVPSCMALRTLPSFVKSQKR